MQQAYYYFFLWAWRGVGTKDNQYYAHLCWVTCRWVRLSEVNDKGMWQIWRNPGHFPRSMMKILVSADDKD